MSLPERNNPYAFDEYLQWRSGCDYYRDDPFFQKVVKHFTGGSWQRIHEELSRLSAQVSFRWRDFSEQAAVPEKRPFVTHFDGHNHRIDRIVRPLEVLTMEKEVFSEALFSARTHPWMKLAKMYLIYQNGEACTACPLTCTEGLVELLKKFADSEETRRILLHCSEGIDGDFGIGAQYLSEIQGGSDVPSNVVEAVEDGGTWRLYGKKFFCSATHADYAVVTAKPAGSEKVALFVVPSWLPGDKARERRNGCVIDRIKWKLGTSELTTAEITYDGAVAYPVGPLDRGVANVVGIVLTYSRLTVGLSSAAFMTRAVREAVRYAGFREAFGLKIGMFPLLARQLRWMETSARRTTAGAFRLYRDFLGLEQAGSAKDDAAKRKRFAVRELIMLQKIAATWDCTDVIRMAMSVFGGHGVMEDFSCLPRLLRDSAINELWEGPRNVLLTQIHRDFQRAGSLYAPRDFVRDLLAGADDGLVRRFAAELEELLAQPDLFTMDEKTLEVCGRWDSFCQDLTHAYQDCALAEVEAA